MNPAVNAQNAPRWAAAIWSAVTVFLVATPVSAQEDRGTFAIMGEWLNDGGTMMYVILLVSIVGTVVFLERVFDLYLQQRLATRPFLANILSHLEARQYRSAYEACAVRSRHPLVGVVREGVMRANRREKEIERAMEKEMLGALPRLQRRVGLLSLLANTATLMGLLGTIFGLITAFNSVAMASAAERQEALAAGISQAMYTTAFGISVAVPMLFFHHFVAKRMETIVMEVEEGATSVLVALAGGSEEQSGRARGVGGAAERGGEWASPYGAARRA
jgi:biopolymer transport protein ExbB/TolQ